MTNDQRHGLGLRTWGSKCMIFVFRAKFEVTTPQSQRVRFALLEHVRTVNTEITRLCHDVQRS